MKGLGGMEILWSYVKESWVLNESRVMEVDVTFLIHFYSLLVGYPSALTERDLPTTLYSISFTCRCSCCFLGLIYLFIFFGSY